MRVQPDTSPAGALQQKPLRVLASYATTVLQNDFAQPAWLLSVAIGPDSAIHMPIIARPAVKTIADRNPKARTTRAMAITKTEVNAHAAMRLASARHRRASCLERSDTLPMAMRARDIDEAANSAGETPSGLTLPPVLQHKLQPGSIQHPEITLLIGSDSIALLDGASLSKPKAATAAAKQLRACSGKH